MPVRQRSLRSRDFLSGARYEVPVNTGALQTLRHRVEPVRRGGLESSWNAGTGHDLSARDSGHFGVARAPTKAASRPGTRRTDGRRRGRRCALLVSVAWAIGPGHRRWRPLSGYLVGYAECPLENADSWSQMATIEIFFGRGGTNPRDLEQR